MNTTTNKNELNHIFTAEDPATWTEQDRGFLDMISKMDSEQIDFLTEVIETMFEKENKDHEMVAFIRRMDIRGAIYNPEKRAEFMSALHAI